MQKLSKTVILTFADNWTERTFLAWLRTSLSFASIGIAVTQLFRLNSAAVSESSNAMGAVGDVNVVHDSHHISRPENYLRSSPSLLEVLLVPPTPAYDSIDSMTTTVPPTNQYRNLGKPLGVTFIGVAVLILLIGFHRYFESQYWIVRGKFPASRGSIALITFVAAGLVISSFVLILVIAPNATES